MNSKVIFVIGNPRSGTSLLRIMLHSHPSICIPPECGYIQWWWKKYKDWSILDSASTESINAYITDLASSKKIETWSLDFKSLKQLILHEKPSNYSELSLLAIQQYGTQQGKKPICLGDKNNYYIEYLDLLEALYPHARVLHLVRDGRDVACSYLAVSKLDSNSPYLPKLSNSIKEIAEDWVRNNIIIENFMARREAQYNLRVRFEDIILYTKETLTLICKWLGLEYSEEMMEYTNSSAEPTATLDWKKKTREKPDKENIGRFKEILGQKEIALFNHTAKEMLVKYAYDE